MHKTGAACPAAGVAFSAQAQVGPALGRNTRDYSGAHLASHSDQVVDWIKLQDASANTTERSPGCG